MKYSLLIIVSVFSFFQLTSCNSGSEVSDAELDAIAEKKAEQAIQEELNKLKDEQIAENAKWIYSEKVDEMSSKKIRFAQNISKNYASLDFPYEGRTTLQLVIRDSKKNDGYDVFIKASQGQLMTDYRNPKILVKFDDSEAEYFSVSDEASGNSEYLFFDSPNKLVDNLREAETVKIECVFYNNGSHVYEFNTSDFKF